MVSTAGASTAWGGVRATPNAYFLCRHEGACSDTIRAQLSDWVMLPRECLLECSVRPVGPRIVTPTGKPLRRTGSQVDRLWHFLSRPRTPQNSPALFWLLAAFWMAGVLALIANLDFHRVGPLGLSAVRVMFQEVWWPALRAMGLWLIIFLAIVSALAAASTFIFAMLPDLQSDRSWAGVGAVLVIEGVVAMALSVFLTGTICQWAWP